MSLSTALVDEYALGFLPELAAGLTALGVEVVQLGDALPTADEQHVLSQKSWVAVISGRTLNDVRQRTAALVASLCFPVPVIAVVPPGAKARDLHGPHIVDVMSPDTPRCADRVVLMSAVPVVTRSGKKSAFEAVKGSAPPHPFAVLAIEHPMTTRLPPLVAMASSTGGISVVVDVLRDLSPGASEAVLLAQHIQTEFVPCFATWLAETSGWPVEVVNATAELRGGVIYIAGGGLDLCVDAAGARALTPVSTLIPNADRLFRSVAGCAGSHAVGVVLSGMGSDGAAGLLELARVGAGTLCQLPASAALASMPNSALQAVPQALVRAPEDIATSIREALGTHGAVTASPLPDDRPA